MRPARSRRGFTLLEVTLALSVGVLLLAALYVAVDVQLRHARAGRNIVEQATLARSLLNRMDADITAAAALVDPERFRAGNNSSSSGGSSSASTSPSNSNSSAGNSGNTGSNSGSSSGSSVSGGGGSTAGGSASINDAISLPLSVQGDSTSLNLFVSRVPREAIPSDPNATPQIVSDLRRVSWWLPSGGLARQEITVATSQDALDNLPPGIPDEESFIIASEVKNIQFQYFDGSDWQDSWDCTSPGADGVTPIGPPLAIAITIEIANPQEGSKDEEPPTKRYRHVVACMTANGSTPQQQNGNANGNAAGGTSQ
jgi:prepilin-type N-terminal cleavage/methylation domain-containing protein